MKQVMNAVSPFIARGGFWRASLTVFPGPSKAWSSGRNTETQAWEKDQETELRFQDSEYRPTYLFSGWFHQQLQDGRFRWPFSRSPDDYPPDPPHPLRNSRGWRTVKRSPFSDLRDSNYHRYVRFLQLFQPWATSGRGILNCSRFLARRMGGNSDPTRGLWRWSDKGTEIPILIESPSLSSQPSTDFATYGTRLTWFYDTICPTNSRARYAFGRRSSEIFPHLRGSQMRKSGGWRPVHRNSARFWTSGGGGGGYSSVDHGGGNLQATERSLFRSPLTLGLINLPVSDHA